MPDRDRYIPGVPCWVDTSQPDPEAATAFYGALFGWEFEDTMPPGSETTYLSGQIRGKPVAGVTSIADGAPPTATWNTYVAVEDAGATAAKAFDAGGSVLTEPFDVPNAGRMAVLADTEGAAFCVWQAGEFVGSQVVNEHGSVNFNDLQARDPEAAKTFYGALFGWGTMAPGGGGAMWTLPGYGDHLEELNPGMRAGMKEMGAPEGFEDVVGSLAPLTDGEPHWGVMFAVDDADAAAAKAGELGATVLAGPFDAPWTRMAVIADPQGATFVASQFVPENRDLPAPNAAANAS